MKKILSVILATLMLLTILPMASFAVTPTEVLNSSGITLEGAEFTREIDGRNDAYPWAIDSTTLGVPAIKTTNQGKNSTNSLLCFHVTGQGYLEINVKVSTEEGWDIFRIQSDGQTVAEISGDVEKTIRVKLVGEGREGLEYHRVFAYFSKDTADADGADTVWITGLKFTPVAELPVEATVNGTPYYSLSSAMNAANNSEEDCTVVLMADAESSMTIYNPNEKTITLDLNGHVLTSKVSNNIDVYTPFVLTDSKIDEGTGKYLSLHENSFYNDEIGSVTIRNAVVENTYTGSTGAATLVYAPKAAYPLYIEGAKTQIIFTSNKGRYTYNSNQTVAFIREGAFFNVDPSVFTKEFGVEVYPVDGGYTVSYGLSNKKWLFYHSDDEADLSISADGKTYTVKTAEGLAQIAYLVNTGAEKFSGKTVVLANDIDLGAYEWVSIGSASGFFRGTFDGQGHTISNLYIKKGGSDIGFFTRLRGTASNKCVVKNVNFNNAYVQAGKNDSGAGVVAGRAYDQTVIQNVNVSGKIFVASGRYVGGISGNMSYADHLYCTVDGKNDEAFESEIVCLLDGANTNYAGGIIGQLGEGKRTVDHCTVKNITIKSYGYGSGGIAGVMQRGGNVITNNTVENVHFEAYAEDVLGWTGSVVGKDFTNKDYAPAILYNNTVDYTATVSGIENEYIFYVGDDHSHTNGTPGEYVPNAVVVDNAVIDENGKIVKGDFIFIGENAKTDASAIISPDVVFEDVTEGFYDSTLNHSCTPADDYDVTVEPTCTTKGEKVLKCKVCGDILDTREIGMIPHVDEAPFNGFCDICGTNCCTHVFGEYVLSKEATATSDAEETATCTICGETDTRTIPNTALDVAKKEAIDALNLSVIIDGTEKMKSIAKEGIAAINAATSLEEVRALYAKYSAQIKAERDKGIYCEHPVTGLCFTYVRYTDVPFIGLLLALIHRLVHVFHR